MNGYVLNGFVIKTHTHTQEFAYIVNKWDLMKNECTHQKWDIQRNWFAYEIMPRIQNRM